MAISSKFETREDIGMLPVGLVCVGPRGEARQSGLSHTALTNIPKSKWLGHQRLLLACGVGHSGLAGACPRSLSLLDTLQWWNETGGIAVACAVPHKVAHLDVAHGHFCSHFIGQGKSHGNNFGGWGGVVLPGAWKEKRDVCEQPHR